MLAIIIITIFHFHLLALVQPSGATEIKSVPSSTGMPLSYLKKPTNQSSGFSFKGQTMQTPQQLFKRNGSQIF